MACVYPHPALPGIHIRDRPALPPRYVRKRPLPLPLLIMMSKYSDLTLLSAEHMQSALVGSSRKGKQNAPPVCCMPSAKAPRPPTSSPANYTPFPPPWDPFRARIVKASWTHRYPCSVIGACLPVSGARSFCSSWPRCAVPRP